MFFPDFLRGRIRVALALCVLALVLMGACSKKKKPNEPEVPVAPIANSPRNALALLEWSWDQRDVAAYRTVFTEDYLYDFAVSDSQLVGVHIDRAQELVIANHLFVQGAPGHPAATGISFGLDNVINFQADDRPGKDATVHKRATSNVRLVVNTPGPDYSITGTAIFYLTRGDSALIPQELIDAGARRDSTRWYVDHWTDTSDCPAGKACVTVGRIKLAYR